MDWHTKRKLWLGVIGVLGLAVLFSADRYFRLDAEKKAEATLNQSLRRVARDLREEVRARILAVESLGAFMQNAPTLPAFRHFDEFAKRLHQEHPTMRGLAYVDGQRTIRHFYPRQGNEAAIGLDLRMRPAAPFVEAAIRERRTTVNHPVRTVQGSLSIVARTPFTRDGRFAGLVQGVFEISPLVSEAMVSADPRIGFILHDAQGKAFFGPDAFPGRTVRQPVPVGDNQWTLTAGWKEGPPGPPAQLLFLLWVVGSTLLVTVLALVDRRLAHEHRLERAVAERTRALHDSEQLMRLVMETMPVGVWVTDREGKIISGNPEGQRIWGGARYVSSDQYGEYKGWWADTGRPIAANEWALARAVQHGETTLNEVIDIEGFDGVRRTILNSATPIRDEQGEIAGALVVNQDISEHRRAEETLRSSEGFLRLSQHLAHIGSWEWNLDTGQVRWSDEMYEIHGMKREHFDGTPAGAVRWVVPADRPRVQALIEHILADGEPYAVEYEIVRPDGEPRVLWGKGELVDSRHDGRPRRVIGTVLDITGRKQAERRILQLNRLLRTITEIDQLVVRERSRDRLLEESCRILVVHGEYRLAWIGLKEPDSVTVRVAAHAGDYWEYLTTVDIRCDDSPQGRGPTGTAIREGRHVIFNSLASDPDFAPWRERAQEHGLLSSAAFPLRVDGNIIGAINVYAGQTGAFGDDEVALLDELAEDISYALKMQDVAEAHARAEQALARSEANFRTLTENANVGILVNYRGLHVFANRYLLNLLGYTADTIRHTGVREVVHPDEYDRVMRIFQARLAGQAVPNVYETVFVTRDGRAIPVELTAARTQWQGEPAGLVFVHDIRERQRAEAEMRKLSSAIDQTADSIVITDRAGRIEYVNPAFEQTTGYTRDEAIGQTPRLVKSGRHDTAYYENLWTCILAGDVFRDVLINRRKDGTLYYEEKTITPLKDANGAVTHFVSTGKDVTDRMQAEERLQYMAQHDALTALPNRTLLLDRLTQSLARARWHQRLVGVLFVDLDRFKTINDTLGHEIGDRLLQLLAERFSHAVREGDTVARFGGDEFVVHLDDVATASDVALVAQKILDTLAQPFSVDEHSLYITASIGISLFPNDGDQSGVLLKHADTAMYRAKEAGKNNYQFYSADMSARAFERLTLETSLRHALERQEFVLHYQPQVDVDSGQIIGVEALIRWQHPEFGLVAPVEFIPLLEETGLIAPVGEWVLQTACRQLREWHEAGWRRLRLAVNLSPRQVHAPGLVPMVENVLNGLSADPGWLELEITEGLLVQHAPRTLETLQALRSLGVRLAVDDFGTGYSSLAYLRRYPIETLKVDRSFVRDIPQDSEDCAITTAILALSQGLRLEAIAEGVEDPAQRDFLRSRGCRLMQGFLFSRPRPATEITELLKNGGLGGTLR